MSLNTGARLLRQRIQPTPGQHGLYPRAASTSAILFRLVRNQSQLHSASRLASSPRLSKAAAQTQHRTASTSAPSQAEPTAAETRDSARQQQPPPPPSGPADGPLSDPLNPPASTRPPPLDLPTRDPAVNVFVHFFRLGKAYMTFYKTGLKAVFTNRRLLRDLPDTSPPRLPLPPASAREAGASASPSGDKSSHPTRAALLLRARVRHDTARLPLFALVMLVCGEFTPLVVLLFPRLTPYTCRIPSQAAVIRRGAEARRAASLRALSYVSVDSAAALAEVGPGHVCRSLGLGSPVWDRLGLDVPFAASRARAAVALLARDDALIRAGGGVPALVDPEVVLACEERGIDTLDVALDVAPLRRRLEAWVAKSAPSHAVKAEAVAETKDDASDRITRLLLRLDGPL